MSDVMLHFLVQLTGDSEIEQKLLNGYQLVLSNKKQVFIQKKVSSKGEEYPWKIEDQFFFDNYNARDFLKRRIEEKLTGTRVLTYRPAKIPEICGINGAACRAKGRCNTALCYHCPIADKFFAERDGVKLVYALQTETEGYAT